LRNGGGTRGGCPDPREIACPDGCVNLQTDPSNCGRCSHECQPTQDCCNGKCVASSSDTSNCGQCGNVCPSGYVCCNGTCRNLNSDVNNCGACGVVCPSGQTCCAGQCCTTCCTGRYQTLCCPPGATCEPGRDPNDPSDRSCRQLPETVCDLNSLTACLNAAQLTYRECLREKPASVCNADQYYADAYCNALFGCLPKIGGGVCCPSGQCTHLDDTSNCGACGKPCAPGQICTGGICCQAGQVNCGGKCCTAEACCTDSSGNPTCCFGGSGVCCVSMDGTAKNCCGPGDTCSSGLCCPKGQVNCGEQCCPCCSRNGNDCCSGVCCLGDSGTACCEGSSPLCCGGICCSVSCCKPDGIGCCPPGQKCCGSTCCPAGSPCCGDSCQCTAPLKCFNNTCTCLDDPTCCALPPPGRPGACVPINPNPAGMVFITWAPPCDSTCTSCTCVDTIRIIRSDRDHSDLRNYISTGPCAGFNPTTGLAFLDVVDLPLDGNLYSWDIQSCKSGRCGSFVTTNQAAVTSGSGNGKPPC